jgi:hypothetical protein
MSAPSPSNSTPKTRFPSTGSLAVISRKTEEGRLRHLQGEAMEKTLARAEGELEGYLREHIAPLLGIKPSEISPGRVTYDLRRLRLHGLIERIPKTHSYRITAKGLRTAIFYTRLYNRSLRTGLALISPDAANANMPIVRSIRAAEADLNTWYDQENLVAENLTHVTQQSFSQGL